MNRSLAAGRRSVRYAFLLGCSLVGACGGLTDDVSLGNDGRDQNSSGPRFAEPSEVASGPVFVPKPGAGECDELADACSGGPDGGSVDPDEPWIVTQSGLYQMALDTSHLYWLLQPGNDPEFWRVDRVSGHKERLLVTAESVYSFAIDATHLYFTHTLSVFEGSIRRMPKGGGEVEVIASGIFNPTRLTLDDTYVYYNIASIPNAKAILSIAEDGALYRVGKNGGVPELLASPLDGPWDFAVDATHLFLSEMNAGRIQRYPKAGGAPTTLFQTYATGHVILSGDFAYFTECPVASCEPGAARLTRVPRSGGNAELLHDVIDAAGSLATRSDAVVWGNWLVPLDGSTASRLVPDAQQIIAVAADDSETFLGNYRGTIYKLDH
ncbi:MAG TPA: hypothetical protein VI072_25325 [Polyangiaceae bacterium]